MALKPVRRKGSEFWYIRGTFHGHKVNVTAQTRDISVAKKFQRELEKTIAVSGPPSAKRDIVSFEKAADLYLDHHNRSETDRRAIARLVAELGQHPVDEIKAHMIADAAIKLYPDGSAATRNRMAIMNAGAIMHYAADQDLCGYLKVKRFKEQPVAPRDVDVTVARTLINSTQGREQLLLVMMFRQGWRISELLEIEWPHIDLAQKAIQHHNKKVGLYDDVPMHDEVTALVAVIPEAERTGNLFPWPDRWAVYDWLWPLTKKLGVRFTPHMARHSFATWLVGAGASGFDLLATGNWTDLKSVKRYTRLDRNRARSVINSIKS